MDSLRLGIRLSSLLFVGWLIMVATGTPVPDVAWQVGLGAVGLGVIVGALSPGR